MEEEAYPCNLHGAGQNDCPAQSRRIDVCSRELAGNPGCRPRRNEPVCNSRNAGIVSLVTFVGPRKKPERDTQYHHHHESNEYRVRMRADQILRRKSPVQLALYHHPPAEREPDTKKCDRGLEVPPNESVHLLFYWKTSRYACRTADRAPDDIYEGIGAACGEDSAGRENRRARENPVRPHGKPGNHEEEPDVREP